MSSLLDWLRSPGTLPHGFCYQWNPLLMWLHAVSDVLIALAYFSIPIVLVRFVRKRRDLPFDWMFVCFAVFIAACGSTHLIEVWTLWVPAYWFSGGVKVLTAVASVPTAIFLVRLLPQVLLLPSPAEMRAANEELRRQQAVLKESEQRFRQMADNIQEIFWIVDPETKQATYVSPAFEQICELPLDAIGRAPFCYRELIHPGDRARVLRALDALATDGRFDEEFRIICPSGRVKWMHAIGFTAKDQAGNVAKLVGTAQEITVRKEMEFVLRESEDRYRDLVEHSHDLICTHTLDGRLLSVNELPARLLGYTRAELLNKPMRDFLLPEYRALFDEGLETLKASGSLTGQMVVLTKSGERRIWEFHNTVRTDGVSPPIVRGVAHDVTERKQAEFQLRKLSGRLLQLQDEERRRISIDLHDSTGQELVALTAMLKQLHDQIPVAKRNWRKLVSRCQHIADQTLREVRTLSYVLHPPMLDESGLPDAVQHYLNGFRQRTGIVVGLDISSNFGRLPKETEVGLFRVVQESLLNIQRHSGSQTANVQLTRDPEHILLQVSDSGHGIAPGKMKNNGMVRAAMGVGIASMEERVNHVGGKLELRSNHHGTIVRVMVPVHEACA